MIIAVDVRETALIDELRDNPVKTMTEYAASAQARKCYISLDGDEANLSQPATDGTVDVKAPLICKNANHTLVRERMAIGDIILRTADPGADIMLIERKTLADFAASIRDGRYKEQSFRLDRHCELANHNIIYVIEGDISKYVDRTKGGNIISRKALYSAMFSMLYCKGFSVIRTQSIRETADLILNFADKYDLLGETARAPYYGSGKRSQPPSPSPRTSLQPKSHANAEAESSAAEYAEVFKHKERASQITPDNIGEIMISAIPCVSAKTAATIMCEFKTMANLIERMKCDRSCLDGLYNVAQTGSKRKLSKICVDNLFKFLIG
jgi:ERCC4-type nuclease